MTSRELAGSHLRTRPECRERRTDHRQAALGHYQFETLHPYADGNGRLGRLIAILQLIEDKSLATPCLNLSPWFEARRNAYVDGLLRVTHTGDFSSWVQFFSEASSKGTGRRRRAGHRRTVGFQGRDAGAPPRSRPARECARDRREPHRLPSHRRGQCQAHHGKNIRSCQPGHRPPRGAGRAAGDNRTSDESTVRLPARAADRQSQPTARSPSRRQDELWKGCQDYFPGLSDLGRW